VSTLSRSAPSHNRLSRAYVLSAAWQRHVPDCHRALKKARDLSLKVTYQGFLFGAKLVICAQPG
jgi:hypothetical protein